MSKKLIAVASAAALALAGLVGIAPANSAVGPFAVSVSGTTSTATTARDGTTSTKALQINVPSTDVIRLTATHATLAQGDSTAIKFDVVTPGATDVVTVTSTGGVELISTTEFDDDATTATGKQSLTVSAANGDAAFYAYTTSTAAGTVVVSSGGSSKTYYVAGLSLWAYKVNFTAPATAALAGEFSITGTVKDAFGNDLTTALSVADVTTDWTFTLVGATQGAASYSATTKAYTFKFTAPSTATGTAINLAIDDTKKSTSVTALGTPVLSQFFTVSAVDLAAQVTALTAQVAALTADYNALAAKWNKRVASKKAPKKAVATK
jgi:hypothetical protein